MKPIIYNMAVGTADISMTKNRLSRAYALLNTRTRKGKVFGFQYRFSSQYKTQVERDFSLSERPIDQPSSNLSGLVQAEDNITPRTQILNGSELAEPAVSKEYNILNSIKIGNSGVDNDTELLSLFKISINNESEANHLKVFGNAVDTDTVVEVTPLMTMADNYISGISEIYNSLKTAINNESQAINMRIFRSMMEYRDRNADVLNLIEMDSGIDNESFIQQGLLQMINSPNLTRIMGGNIKLGIDREELSTILQDPNMTAYWLDEQGVFLKSDIRANADSDLDVDVLNKLVIAEGANGDNISIIDDWIKLSTKLYIESITRSEFYLGDSIRKKADHYDDLIALQRSGKDKSMIVRNEEFAKRYGKDSFVNWNGHIFSLRQPKNSANIKRYTLANHDPRKTINNDILKTKYRMSKIQRPGVEIDGVIRTDRVRKNAMDFFDNDILFSDRMNDEINIVNPYILSAKQPRVSRLIDKIKYAINPNRPVFRLYNIFPADVLTKVIFSDRAKKPFIMLRNFEPAQRPGRDCLLVVDMREAINKEAIAEIKRELEFAISQEKQSVIMLGLIESDNKESDCDILVTEIADGKNSVETTVNLISLGYGKVEHLTEFSNIINAESDDTITEAVKAVLQLAVDVSKKRSAIQDTVLDAAGRFYTKESPAILSGYLVSLASARKSLQANKLHGIIDSEWDTEWSKLTKIYMDSRDKNDRIKVPNDDYNYEKLTKDLYNQTTGIPKDPIGPTNKAEVEVKFPNEHYNPKYKNLYREIIPVDLYCYKDMMLLIWIFWCKHRSSENVIDVLKEFYETENIEMTLFQEYAKIVQFDAARAINYVLDNINQWVQRTIAYFDKDRMMQYERIMKQVRWFGEKIAHDMSKYVLVREYDKFSVDHSSWIANNHLIPIDGDITVEAYIAAGDTIAVYVNDDIVLEINTPGVYRISNPTNSSYILHAPTAQLDAGIYNIKLVKTGSGNSVIYECFISNSVFKSASIRYEGQPGQGTQAIDKLIQMMYDYYEIHHKSKTKGPRDLWMWS